MTATAFDTLKAARDLEAAGIDSRQAEAIVSTIRQSGDAVATKADVEAVRIAMSADLEAVRIAMSADLEAVRIATRADLDTARSAMRADLAELKSDMLKVAIGNRDCQRGIDGHVDQTSMRLHPRVSSHLSLTLQDAARFPGSR